MSPRARGMRENTIRLDNLLGDVSTRARDAGFAEGNPGGPGRPPMSPRARGMRGYGHTPFLPSADVSTRARDAGQNTGTRRAAPWSLHARAGCGATWHITNIEFARRLRAAGWVAEGSQLRDPSGNLLRDFQFVIVGPDGRETTADDPLHKRLEVFLVQRHMVAFRTEEE